MGAAKPMNATRCVFYALGITAACGVGTYIYLTMTDTNCTICAERIFRCHEFSLVPVTAKLAGSAETRTLLMVRRDMCPSPQKTCRPPVDRMGKDHGYDAKDAGVWNEPHIQGPACAAFQISPGHAITTWHCFSFLDPSSTNPDSFSLFEGHYSRAQPWSFLPEQRSDIISMKRIASRENEVTLLTLDSKHEWPKESVLLCRPPKEGVAVSATALHFPLAMGLHRDEAVTVIVDRGRMFASVDYGQYSSGGPVLGKCSTGETCVFGLLWRPRNPYIKPHGGTTTADERRCFHWGIGSECAEHQYSMEIAYLDEKKNELKNTYCDAAME